MANAKSQTPWAGNKKTSVFYPRHSAGCRLPADGVGAGEAEPTLYRQAGIPCPTGEQTGMDEIATVTVDKQIVELLVELNNKLDGMILFMLSHEAKRTQRKAGLND